MRTQWESPQNEDVICRCRRSGIGLAANIGDGVLFAAIIITACIDLYARTGHRFFVALSIVSIFPIWYAVYGFLSWKAEVHVVSTYKHKEGGTYRKITGPFSIKIEETSITRATPDIFPESPFALRVWGFFTGQDVIRITLRSDGQSIIASELMPVRLYKDISNLKGEPPKRRARDTHRLNNVVTAIMAAHNNGLIRKNEATLLVETALRDEVL